MNFREDINGLRAIAVLSVILFHIDKSLLNGGYLGVDIFFVISGFLITSNILRSVQSNNFSYTDFYDRRLRRIIPALYFTLFICLVFALIALVPYGLKSFGQELLAGTIGANNILLYLTTGYWSTASEYKLLYHTWSLGVEEQYYFVIPILFILLKRHFSIKVVFWILFFLSWFACLLYNENQELIFLMLPFRFWQLCAGSLLALYYEKIKSNNSALSIFGLFLILISFISPYFLSRNSAVFSLIPVIGTILVINYNSPDSLISKLLRFKYISLIGLSSYSIYLFHQPVLAFLRFYFISDPPIIWKSFYMILIIPLGILSYKFLENPFRSKNIVSAKLFYTLILAISIFYISFGFYLHASYGLQGTKFFSHLSYGNHPKQYNSLVRKQYKETFTESKHKILVIGNSFARDVFNSIKENTQNFDCEMIYLENYHSNINVSRNLAKQADIVLWVSSSGMADSIEDEHSLLEKNYKIREELDVYATDKYRFIGTKDYGINNNFVRFKSWDIIKDIYIDIPKNTVEANRIEKEFYAEKYIDLLAFTSANEQTRIFTDDQSFISFDTNHWTKSGAKYIGKFLIEELNLLNRE